MRFIKEILNESGSATLDDNESFAMNTRSLTRQNESLKSIAFFIYSAFALLILSWVIYAQAKKYFRKQASQKKELDRIRSKMIQRPETSNADKKNPLPVQPQITKMNVSYSESALVPVTSTSQYQQDKSRQSAARASKSGQKKNSYAYIQDLISQRQARRDEAKRAAIDEANLKAERRAAQKIQHAQKMSSMKQAKASQRDTSSITEEPERPAKTEQADLIEPQTKPLSIVYEARSSLETHALYLMNFSFRADTDLHAVPFQSAIQTLAFIYHYHRYNLARRILAVRHNQEGVQNAVELRTLIVHLTNKIMITPEIIHSTQSAMREFLHTETASLIQHYSRMWRSYSQTQSSLNHLADRPVNSITFASMETLPLTKLIYHHKKDIDHLPDSPANVSSSACLLWFQQFVIPFLVEAHKQSLSPSNHISAGHVRFNEYVDAVKMMIIIAGEYCRSTKIKKMMKHLDASKSENDPDSIMNFFTGCRMLRNRLAHDIFDIDDGDLENLLSLVSGFPGRGMNIQSFQLTLAPAALPAQTLFHPSAAGDLEEEMPSPASRVK